MIKTLPLIVLLAVVFVLTGIYLPIIFTMLLGWAAGTAFTIYFLAHKRA